VTPTSAPNGSHQHHTRQKQAGSRTKHQPINLVGSLAATASSMDQLPQPYGPLLVKSCPQCRVKPPGVHKHRRIPNRASRHAKISSTCPHRRVDPTSSGGPACPRSGPVPHSMPPLAHNWLLVTEIFFAFDTLAASPSPTPKQTRASQRAQMPHSPLSNHK